MKKMTKRVRFALILLLIVPAASHAETYRFARYWPTLKQPWYFNFPNAVAIDSQEYVYVADGGNRRIVKFTADGQFVSSWAGSAENGVFFDTPYGIAVDRADRIYVSDEYYAQISVFDTDGRYLRKWDARDEDGRLFRPAGIAADERGYIYLVDSSNERVRAYTEDGMPIGGWNGGENGGDPMALPEGVAVDDRGNVFVTDIENHEVRAFSVSIAGDRLDAVPAARWGEFGIETGRFRNPAGIAARDGEVFVVDIRNDRVQVFDFQGNFLRMFGMIGDEEGQFYASTGIDIAPDGTVYVAGKNRRRIQKFRADGSFVAAWQSMGTGEGKLQLPRGLDTDEAGNLYVADKNNDRIQVFSPDGIHRFSWGETGTGEGQFDLPFDLLVSDGSVFVADTNNHRIQAFDLQGDFQEEWLVGEGGEEDTPYNLARAPDGTIFVTNFGKSNVHRLIPGIGWAEPWGRRGRDDGQLANPRGIAIQTVPDSDDYFVWVSDRGDRLQKFDPNGNFIQAWNYGGIGPTRFDDPEGLWIENERIYVADSYNNRIQIYDHDGNHLETVGEFGSGPGQFRTPTDLCIHGNRLYVTDSDNNRIQVFERIDTVANRKAILVAGGGPYEGNLLWDATRLNAGFALRALAFQGFAASDIRYLTADDQTDLDFDGKPDPVFPPTLAELEAAVRWAGDAEQVAIYLVNHGGVNPEGAGVFRMSPTENLTGADLNAWLTEIQTDGTPEIILVADFCAAGRFLEDLADRGANGRILLSGTTGDEEAYFLGQGAGSFSHGFWSGVFNGADIREAFARGREAVGGDPPLQRPALDVDGDGEDDFAADEQAGRGKYIGNGSFVSGGSGPTLANPTAEETENGVILRVNVEDSNGISRVWAVVRPPGEAIGSDLLPPDTPILELPAIDLVFNGTEGFHEGTLTGLAEAGRYTLLVFAADRDGNVSPPSPVAVDIGTPIRRKAVLLAAGDTASPRWPAAENAIVRAFTALRFQGYAETDIRAFAPATFFGGIFGAPTLDNLRFSLSDWIEDDAKDLVFFWIGEGNADGLPLSDGETLTPETLDGWLDDLQARLPGPVVVIGDSDGAGGWIPALLPPEGKERIVLTGASADGAALRSPEGAISFSSLFWKEILAGRTVGRAFLSARNAAAFFGDGLETGPQWDDNGNGIAGERGEGNLALRTAIGAGIRLAANDPTGAEVSEETIIAEAGRPVSLRVSGVQSGSGAVSVAAVVASPDGATAEIPLTLDGGTGDYTGEFDGFTASGYYPVSYFAANGDGAVSSLGGRRIFQPFGEDAMDFGEASDDSPEGATLLVVNDPSPDHHNFFEAGDADWFRFFAIQGQAYEIRARASVASGNGVPVSLSLFREGTSTPLETRESAGDATELDWEWICAATGIYQIKVQSANSEAVGSDTGYTIQIVRPVGPFAGFLQGAVLNAATGTPLTNVRLRTSADASALTRPNGRFLMIQEPGEFELTIEADGYEPLVRIVAVSDLGTTELNLSLRPMADPPEPPPSPADPSPPPAFPVAAFSATPLAGEAPLSVRFADRSTVSAGWMTRREWDFGDGTVGSESDPVHVYEAPGTYTVRLRVFSNTGHSDTEIRTDWIVVSEAAARPGAPVADFGMSPATGSVPFAVSLTDRSTGEIAERIWRADGAVFAENVADATYAVEECRDVEISLTVAGPGGTDEASRTVLCADPSPETGVLQGRIGGIPDGTTVALEIAGEPVPMDAEGNFRVELPPGEYPLILVASDPASETSETLSETMTVGPGETMRWDFIVGDWWTPPVFQPAAPEVSLPEPDGAGDSEDAVRLAARFVPVRDGQTHAATRWQIAESADFSALVLDIETPEYLAALPVPPLALKPETGYRFRVRFVDETGAESEWSETVAFETPTDPEDADRDGVPDAQAIPWSEIGDSSEDGIRWLRTAGGDSRIGLETSAGTIQAAASLHPDRMAGAGGRPESLPLGLTAARIAADETGARLQAGIHWSRTPPPGTDLYLHTPADGWRNAGAVWREDRRFVRISLEDGGPGDADGATNGVIVVLFGPGTPPPRASEIPPPPGDADVGGCFVETMGGAGRR